MLSNILPNLLIKFIANFCLTWHILAAQYTFAQTNGYCLRTRRGQGGTGNNDLCTRALLNLFHALSEA